MTLVVTPPMERTVIPFLPGNRLDERGAAHTDARARHVLRQTPDGRATGGESFTAPGRGAMASGARTDRAVPELWNDGQSRAEQRRPGGGAEP